MLATEEFSATKDNLLLPLPVLSKEFKLEFEIIVNSFPDDWVNILHLTTGSNQFHYGSRTPAVFGNGGSNPYLNVVSAINGNKNTRKTFDIATNKWIKVELSQNKNKDGSYLFEWVMDNVVVWSITNNQAEDFYNVNVYASNRWYEPFDGALRNIKLCTHGK